MRFRSLTNERVPKVCSAWFPNRPTNTRHACKRLRRYARQYWYTQPSLIQPSLTRSHPSTEHLSGDVAMVNMALTCTEKHMLGHVRVGACICIMYMYVCMHVHVCASPCILSYGRIRVTGTLRNGGAWIREVECTTAILHKQSLRHPQKCSILLYIMQHIYAQQV